MNSESQNKAGRSPAPSPHDPWRNISAFSRLPAGTDTAGENDAPTPFSTTEQQPPVDPYSPYPYTSAPDPAFMHAGSAAMDNPGQEAPVPILHAVLIAAILLAGLAVGIGRSWWIDEKLDAASSKKTAHAVLPSQPAGQGPAHSSLQSSIDRAYIPSLLHPDEDEAAGGKQARSAANAGAGVAANKPPAPSNGRASEPTSEQEKAMLSNSTSASGNAEPANPSSTANDASDRRMETQRNPGRKAASRKTAPAAKERSREIDRVRSQAFSETSRDRIGEKKSGAPQPNLGPQSERRSAYRASRVAQRTVTRAQYARCERIGNIIRREQCKWELCNNKWGKGACPSFGNEKPFVS